MFPECTVFTGRQWAVTLPALLHLPAPDYLSRLSSHNHLRLTVRLVQQPTFLLSESDTASHLGVLPTPSPELGHSPAYVQTDYRPSQNESIMQDHYASSWEAVPTGSKRSRDHATDFLTDVKKQRIAPSYDYSQSIYPRCLPELTIM